MFSLPLVINTPHYKEYENKDRTDWRYVFSTLPTPECQDSSCKYCRRSGK